MWKMILESSVLYNYTIKPLSTHVAFLLFHFKSLIIVISFY